jgi:phosphopantetheine--protein transferase-like protein
MARKPHRLHMRGVGIDIAHIPRFAAALNRWGAARLCARILHPQEVVDFEAKSESSRAQFLASRFVLWSKVLHRSNSIIFLDGQQKKRSSKQLVLSCPSPMPTV